MKTRYARYTLLTSYGVLLLLLLLQTLMNPPQNSTATPFMMWLAGVGIWLFKVLPLLLFIPGLREGRHTTSAWLAYVGMLYFVLGVLLAFTPGASGWGWGVSICSLVMILAGMFYTRWKKAEQ